MTGAYGVFANDGVKNPPTGILEVQDSSGNVLESYQNQATRVLDPQIAREMDDVLSNDANRQPEFAPGGLLNFAGYDVADKTGTTNDSRDAWVIGYSPSIVVGEWAGNDDDTPMVNNIAALIVVPTWHKIMAYALQKYSSTSDGFPPPAPNPNEASLPPVLQGNWNTDPALGIHDILYWTQKGAPLAGPPSNPWSDPQAAYWDYPVQLWAASQGDAVSTTPEADGSGSGDTSAGSGPTTPAPVSFAITSPQSGQIVSSSATLTVTASAPSNTVSVTYYLNGATLGSATAPPYAISFLPASRGPSTLQAVAKYSDGTSQTTSSAFTIQ
jgi:membrane peptidoglycan carboxypeptidase